MSGEIKFSKLRLPISKRNKSSTSSQISKFFPKANVLSQEDGDGDKNSEMSHDRECSDVRPIGNVCHKKSLSQSNLQTEERHQDVSRLVASLEAANPSKMRRIDSRPASNRNSIKEFFQSHTSEDDFQSPGQKLVKKATNLRKPSQKLKNSKKQTNIRNAFLKREQAFADYVAEQSIIDDVDPNEMQMALALSRSEVENCGLEQNSDATSKEASSTIDAICEKLKEFEHQRLRGHGKSQLYGAFKRKAKWANKFTSLTLRNPEMQHEKFQKKVEELLNAQYNDKNIPIEFQNKDFTITSSFLLNLKSEGKMTNVRHIDYERYSLGEFYVTKVFEPSRNKIGGLLKDIRAIPGRDNSPVRFPLSGDQYKTKCSPHEDFETISSNTLSQKSSNNSENTKESVACGSSYCLQEDQNFFREPSPDIFMDEEEDEPVGTGQPRENINKLTDEDDKLSCMSLGTNVRFPLKNVSNDAVCVDVVTISSESNSINEIITFEDFSSEKVKEASNSGIWNQDLNYTMKNIYGDKDTKESEPIIDLTNENIVDLTQPDIDAEDKIAPEITMDVLHLSQKSRHSEIPDNMSQSSTNSIIVLSDDEVNYSMKVAKGLNVNSDSDKSSDNSDAKLFASMEEVDAGTSVNRSAVCRNLISEKCFSDENASSSKSDGVESTHELILNRTNLSPKYNQCHEKDLNYSLAQEIMSHSFDEQFEMMQNGMDKSDNVAGDGRMVCLNLTQLEDPNYEDLDKWSRNNNVDKLKSRSSTKLRKTHSDSFLAPELSSVKTLKRHSSSKKFDEFIKSAFCEANDCDDSEIDEFDQLVYGNLKNESEKPVPHGSSAFLVGNNSANDSVEEVTIDNKVYLVKTRNIDTMPDYQRMDSPTRMKELYKLGLKPLKKKQAIIMLEYVYNQTHPLLVETDSDIDKESEDNEHANLSDSDRKMLGMTADSAKVNKYDLKDCNGSVLLEDDGLVAEIENEDYLFQTNCKAKVSTVRLPLHLAWFNLIKSNQALREAVLYYEPIDLQEIFKFFKSIGYRFDPKDMKRFFDGRSIIFQYDIGKEGNNRHIRKSQKQKGKVK